MSEEMKKFQWDVALIWLAIIIFIFWFWWFIASTIYHKFSLTGIMVRIDNATHFEMIACLAIVFLLIKVIELKLKIRGLRKKYFLPE
jgi:hypothetical protein